MFAMALATVVPAPAYAQKHVDVNRPTSPLQCDTPVGTDWFGSTERCLDELCGNWNVTNEWLFVDGGKRRRRNPCYGRNPLEFKGGR